MMPALFAMAMAAQTMAAMRDQRRVLIVSATRGDDPALKAQRNALASWQKEADARDLSVVEIVGDHVSGVSDSAAVLRARYRIAPGHFRIALVGKDGHVAYRAAQPVLPGDLQKTIDAMPMRRAGQR